METGNEDAGKLERKPEFTGPHMGALEWRGRANMHQIGRVCHIPPFVNLTSGFTYLLG